MTTLAAMQERFSQALAHFRAGRLPEAELLCHAILGANPEYADAHHLLGQVSMHRGDSALAVASLAQALRAEPTRFDIHLSLASACMNAGDYSAAASSYATAAKLKPGLFEALANRGIALARLGRHEEAETALNEALHQRPDCEPVLTALAGTLHALGRDPEAVVAGRHAVAAAPDRPEAWTNLGLALQSQGQLSEAAAAYQRAIAIAPRFAMAVYNLSHVRQEQWRAVEALRGFHEAVALDPGYEPAWHALLFNSLYDPDQTEQTIFETHLQWGRRFQRRARSEPPSPWRDDQSSRRIRVGYVSPDFRNHSCACFLRPLFAEHDRNRVEIFAYASVRQPDAITGWFQQHASHWRDISGLGDAAIAGLVRDDGIDILVDLAGHTVNQPLGVFAMEPAPVQIAWLGYPATTGLAQIGYRLTDLQADPPGDADHFHTERLVRLPGGFHCYRAPDNAPDVAPSPGSRNGFMTFGSFNHVAKITPEVVATWAEVLRQVPHSRLLLKGRTLRHDDARAGLRAAFLEVGIVPDRLELRPWSVRVEDALSAYGDVDVALDTYPYNGTTTTFEALWMGVPVVTLRDQRHAGRVGASILTHLGRPEWIADDADAYVDIARRLAADLPALAGLRQSLRGELAHSSLADAPGFARKLERTYYELLLRSGPATAGQEP